MTITIESCIWKDLLSRGNELYKKYSKNECNACKGYKPSCTSYLSSKEIERRSKEKESNDQMRGATWI